MWLSILILIVIFCGSTNHHLFMHLPNFFIDRDTKYKFELMIVIWQFLQSGFLKFLHHNSRVFTRPTPQPNTFVNLAKMNFGITFFFKKSASKQCHLWYINLFQFTI